MKTINTNAEVRSLLSDMIEAAQKILTENWTAAGPFIETESKHILDSIATIAKLKETGKINEDQARLHMDIQRETFLSLLLTIKGIRRVQAENAVNASLSVIRAAVNRFLGWSLL